MSNKNNYTLKTSYNALKTVKKQNKTFTYWLVVVALAWVFISSFLGTYAFIKTVSAEEPTLQDYSIELFNDNSISLYDTSIPNYSFDSSSIMVTSSRFMYGSNADFTMSSQNYFSNIRFSLYQDNGDLLFYPTVYVQGVVNPPSLIAEEVIINFDNERNPVPVLRNTSRTSIVNYNGLETYKINALKLDKNSPYGDLTNLDLNNEYSGFAFRVNHSTLSGAFQLFLGIGYEEGLIPIFNSVHIYTQKIWDNSTLTAIYYNVFDYFDINGKLFRIFAPFSASTQSKLNAYGFTDRTYFYNTTFSDNQYYQEGYQQGKQEGQAIGKEQGREQGYNDGLRQGKVIGYNEGVEDANQYTFLGLLTAVVDAPLTALSGLLNFDLLGFNMLNFFYAIITTALILFIVRLVMGK